MLGRQAKVLAPDALSRVLAWVKSEPNAARNAVIVLLSVRAGLRACEIAGLTWGMVLDARGRVGDQLDIRASIAKKASGRRVPLHPELKAALRRLRVCTPVTLRDPECPLILSAKGGAMRANSVVNWFVVLYGNLGLEGCSSHSGRRTFITSAARRIHLAGASLRDVQLLAGHRSIEMTQRYIDGDSNAQRKLVSLL
jgi:integrase